MHTRELDQPQQAFRTLLEPVRALADRHGLVVEPGRQRARDPRARHRQGRRRAPARGRDRAPRQVVFGGDDLGDLPAFEAVAALRAEGLPGLLLASASHEEDALSRLADVVVDGPAGVAAWLRDLTARIRAAQQG